MAQNDKPAETMPDVRFSRESDEFLGSKEIVEAYGEKKEQNIKLERIILLNKSVGSAFTDCNNIFSKSKFFGYSIHHYSVNVNEVEGRTRIRVESPLKHFGIYARAGDIYIALAKHYDDIEFLGTSHSEHRVDKLCRRWIRREIKYWKSEGATAVIDYAGLLRI